MNILGLDLSSKCGWAIREGTVLSFGVQEFPLARGESVGMRYLRFNRWLIDILGPDARGYSRVGLVAYEMPHLRGGYAADLLTNLAGRIQERCAIYGIPVAAPVHPSTLKRWITGRGNAGKSAVIAAVMKRLSWTGDPMTDDEADAIAVLLYTEEQLRGVTLAEALRDSQ